MERPGERAQLPPRAADAAVSGAAALGRLCGACEPTLQGGVWLGAFAPASGALRCVGLLDGTPCPHAMTVELGWGGEGAWGACDVCAVGEALEQLHLDHERPLHETCRWWIEQLPRAPRTWDDGLDGAALCHDLFGVAHEHCAPRGAGVLLSITKIASSICSCLA